LPTFVVAQPFAKNSPSKNDLPVTSPGSESLTETSTQVRRDEQALDNVGENVFENVRENVREKSEAQLQSERFTYQAAKNAIKKKQLATAQGYLKALDNYPLKPYLEYELLAAKLATASADEIDQFLLRYPDSLLADKLTGSLLYFLAERNRWNDFNHYYSPGFSSPAMLCRSALARYHEGDATALDDGINLWNVGHSQPDACNTLFKQLKSLGKLTAEVRWSRFDKAVNAGNASLAKYIQRDMSAEHQKLADLYWQVHNNPSLVAQRAKFNSASIEVQQIIAHGVRKLAQKDPKLAWQHWEHYEAERLFDAELTLLTKHQIVKYLTRSGHLADAEQLLSYSHSLRETSLVEDLIRENLALGDWTAVAAGISMLPAQDQATDRWRYWYARCHEALANKEVDSRAIFAELAQGRSWYGFLSADRLDESYQLEDASVPADEGLKEIIAEQPAMARARELWIIGEQQQARAEWSYAIKNLNGPEILAAGELAKDWGWYNSGIVAMISGNLWDHLSLRFPLAYSDEVTQAAVNSQLDETLIFAVARQESAFASDAVSHAGARGLMQLMPATAKQQAHISGIKNHQTSDLFRPEHNINLGSAYLSKLLVEFKGNRILATAAYNAGQHRVKRWLKTPEIGTPADIWVETIPFKETRNYVQNVMTYSVIYNYRLATAAYINGQKYDIKGRLLRANEVKIAL
jgi:soluble lytic murein transglycosylase